MPSISAKQNMRATNVTYLCFAGVLLLFLLNTYSLDGLSGWFFSLKLEEDTIYSKGYSDLSFRRVGKGDSEVEVLKILGPPLGEVWAYGDGSYLTDLVSFTSGKVDNVLRRFDKKLGLIAINMSSDVVLKIAGTPLSKSWVYSLSPHSRSYRVRSIEFKKGTIYRISHYFYVD